MQEILGGVVAIIAIAITIGIGTSILGSTGSAFDCKTLDGYTASTSSDTATSGSSTIETTGGSVAFSVTFSHSAIRPNVATDVTITVLDPDGDAADVTAATITYGVSGSRTPFTAAASGLATDGTTTLSINDNAAGTKEIVVTITAVTGVTFTGSAIATYELVVASPTGTAESYTGWAKACQDAQRQTTQAWTLIPIILIVIVAAIIITVLRGFYGSTG